MNGEKNGYKVRIFGDQYSLISDEAQEHVEQSAAFVDSVMNEIARRSSVRDPRRIATLASVRIASELLVLQQQLEEMERKHQELIERITQVSS